MGQCKQGNLYFLCRNGSTGEFSALPNQPALLPPELNLERVDTILHALDENVQ